MTTLPDCMMPDGGDPCEAFAEVVAQKERLREALRAAKGYMLNAKIDLETGATKATAINTISGGIRRIDEALKP